MGMKQTTENKWQIVTANYIIPIFVWCHTKIGII